MDIKKIIDKNLDNYDWRLRSFTFTGSGDISDVINHTTRKVWEALVNHHDQIYGTKARKPMDLVLAEARRRGFSYELVKEDISPAYRRPLSDVIGCEEVLAYRFQKGETQFIYKKSSYGRYLYMPKYEQVSTSSDRVTLEAGPLFDLMEEMIPLVSTVREAIDRKVLDLKRDNMIADISFPSLMIKAEQELGSKGIKYYLARGQNGVILYVNVIKDIWFSGPVGLDSADHVFGLVPYGIKRPERVKTDISPEFRVTTDEWGHCESDWRRYKAGIEKNGN